MIPLFKVHMPDAALDALRPTLHSGYIGQGPVVDRFEDRLARLLGTPAVTTMTGTAALQIALRAAGVGRGTSVVSTPMTCSATNLPILALGADVLWADIDPTTGTLDPESVRKTIRPDTKAVMAVDWGGYPCDLHELRAVAHASGALLIEDAAHAFGALYKSRYVGSDADLTCFSFQAIKTITTIEGGLLTAAGSKALRERARLLRWYGIDRNGPRKDLRCEDDIADAGYKANMNDVHAALGLVQLDHLAALLHRTRANAAFFRQRFEGLAGVKLLSYAKDRLSSYWLFTLRVADRDAFRARLAEAGIFASMVHARNDNHSVFRRSRRHLPGVDEFAASQIAIPVGWWLTHDERELIARTVEDWSAKVGRSP